DAHEAGRVSEAIHYNSIARFFESDGATPILRDMVTWSSLPLKSLESNFAVDSSGFSACRFDRWYDQKYGRMRSQHVWVKAHVMTGCLTNVITAVEIGDKDSADYPQFTPLVKATATGFKIGEVSADKAYVGTDNFEAALSVGATPYIAFKCNTTGNTGGLWQKMFHKFCLEKEAYLKCYHRRSNIESTLAMVKGNV